MQQYLAHRRVAYQQLHSLYESHDRPENYQIILDHPETKRIQETFGDVLSKILLCLIKHEWIFNLEFLERLLRYKKENRLRDMELAIPALVGLGFTLNSKLLNNVCDKAGQDGTFLRSVQLMGVMKKSGFLNEHDVLSDEVFRLIKTKKLELYQGLCERNSLDIHILKNISPSDMPKNKKKLEAVIDAYYYAYLCGCTQELNYPSEQKMYVVSTASSWSGEHIPMILKKLHETQRLNRNTFFLACRISISASYFLPTLDLLAQSSISFDFFSQCILDQKKDFREMKELHDLLSIIQHHQLAVMNEEQLKSVITISTRLSKILESLDYLASRMQLNIDTYFWVIHYYEEKPISSLSPGLFSIKKFTYSIELEIAEVIYALSSHNLLDQPLDCMLCLCSSSGANFIRRIFYLNEVSQQAIDLATQTHFNPACLESIITILSFHRTLPKMLPQDQAEEYLAANAILAQIADELSPAIINFTAEQPGTMLKLLELMLAENRMTMQMITTLTRYLTEQTPPHFVKESFYCACLNLPIQFIDMFLHHSSSAEALFKAIQLLQHAVIDFQFTHDYIISLLQKSTDPLLDAEIVKKLFIAKSLSPELLTILATEDIPKKHFILSAISRLSAHHQCNAESFSFILSSKNHVASIQVFLLLKTENISIETYWNDLMAHIFPLSLCYGLLELNRNGLLTAISFKKIAQAKKADLAANAFIQLSFSGISFDLLWDEIIQSESPDQYAQTIIDSTRQIDEHLTVELREAIARHAKPIVARRYINSLLAISSINMQQILRILNSEEAEEIVTALVALSQLTEINDQLTDILIEEVAMLSPLQKYFSLSFRSEALFEKICQTNSASKAEDLINLHELMIKLMGTYPQVASYLEQIFDSSSFNQYQWSRSLAILDSADEVTIKNIDFLLKSSSPELQASAIVALKKAGLYTEYYLSRAIKRENQSPGVYNTLRYLSEQGELNAVLFDFVMTNTDYQTIKAAILLSKMQDSQNSHLDWLAGYTPKDDCFNAAVDIVFVLHNANFLTRTWIEKAMTQKKPTLEDVSCYLFSLPTILLTEPNIKKIFSLAGNCCHSDDEDDIKYYQSPFVPFKDDISLLTHEVLDLILARSDYQYHAENVYTNMLSLKKSGLFQPDIVICCTTKDRTDAIIMLSKENVFDSFNKTVLLKSSDPVSIAKLIILLVKQDSYSQLTADLLLHYLQTHTSNSHFSTVMTQLITNTSLDENMVQYLFSAETDWKMLKTVFYHLNNEKLSAIEIMQISTMNPVYLSAYVTYMITYREDSLKFNDISKLQEYEPILGDEELIKIIKHASTKENQKNSCHAERMQKILNQLWKLCELGDLDIIKRLIQDQENSLELETIISEEKSMFLMKRG